MIVRLVGGLGNQCWQAAFGLSVSAARGEEVFFSYTPNWRPYGLDAYLIDAHIVHESPTVYREPGFTFDPGVYSAPRGATFIGYWQTPKYFNEGLIRAAFTLRNAPSSASQVVADQIRGSNSAFLHVRRTDYTQGHTRDYHGLLPMEYYTAAIEHVRKHCENTKFFVFSDDPQWCRETFPEFTVVDHNATTPHEDIWLMSLCKHAITANSSFSWWGAWLGDGAPGRIVVVPAKWFLADIDTKDLVPERWLRIS
jgi:hypothetical protein